MSNGLWITPDDLDDDLAISPFAVEACEAASFILWGMSGRKWSGIYTVTENYEIFVPEVSLLAISAQVSSPTVRATPGVIPYLSNSRVTNRIKLRGRPVRSIESVTFLGEDTPIDPIGYQLQDHSTAVFAAPVTRSVAIEYTYGALPPAAGRMAARALASQFALLWGGREDECSLPDRVTSVTRQNVSWVLLDNQDFIAELRTGIYAVDLFLKTVNPDKARARSRVFSPDVPRGRRPTTN
jgi:hypothetical protein